MTTDILLARSEIIREPVGRENGYWAGAPGAFFAEDENVWYLTYRIRRPRGVPPDRGGEARIACSTDLRNWTDIWSIRKDRLDSASIEKCALIKGPDKVWRYFISYVDPKDGRWCVSLLRGKSIADLNPEESEPIFKAASLGLEGIKDPWLFTQHNRYYMVLSVALPTRDTKAASHSTLDIFNTGECVSATALAVSTDLAKWEWQGVVFQPEGNGWDQYCRRINSVVQLDGKFLAFYDGSASAKGNYEERTGIAVSEDLKSWNCLTHAGPCLTSPHKTGCLRYIDAQVRDGEGNIFFELARADAAHELRLARIKPEQLNALVQR